MNIVERKRRLQAEALSGAHAAMVPHEAATNDSIGHETDGENSEEADIFERKARFERLHRKYTALQKEKGLLLKGNDLRSNIYLRKMEKLARKDLGLDIIGYKDYTNNLKRFARYNSDLGILAQDSFEKNLPKTPEQDFHFEFKNDNTQGLERVKKYEDAVTIALQKLMRPNNNLMKERDYAALEDLCTNMQDYVSYSL